MKKFFLVLAMLLIASSTSGETIQLTNGKIVEGEIVEESDDSIKVETGIGFPVTYYKDEIEFFDGKELPSEVVAESDDFDEIEQESDEESYPTRKLSDYVEDGVEYYSDEKPRITQEQTQGRSDRVGAGAGMALPNYSIAIKRAQTQEATLALSAIYQAQIGYSHSHGGNYAESLQDLSIGVGPFQTFKNLVVANADVVSCQGNREFFLASLTAKDDSFELYLLEDGRIVCAPCESSLCEKLGYPLW